MADITFLVLIVLMLLALQAGEVLVAGALFLVALVTAKSKFLIIATIIGGVLALVVYSGMGDATGMLVVGGLFVIFLIIAWQDKGTGQEGYYPGAGGGAM